VYRRDVNASNAGAFVRVSGLDSVPNDLGGTQPAISVDGRFVAFTSRSNFDAQDTNNVEDVYRRDANAAGAAAFARVSGLGAVPSDRGGNQPSISGDGRFVAFTSRSNFDAQDTNDADDVYRRDMDSGNASAFIRVTGLASAPADRGGRLPSISRDTGLTVVVTSRTAFEANDTNDADDVYRRTMCP
jgi:Tol biopolymer transport system component